MSKENDSIFGKLSRVEYICTYCGMHTTRNAGRPMPGHCPRRKMPNGKMLPHRWIVNRRYY